MPGTDTAVGAARSAAPQEIYVVPARCTGYRSCEMACAVEHSQSKSLFGAITETPLPRRRIYVEAVDTVAVPVACRHCDEAFCANACITGAIRRDARGFVLLDETRCIGCNSCIMLCPFGVFPDVYAAGDCVETTDVVTGGQQVAALRTNAVSMAHIAAHNMVHGPQEDRMRRFPGVIGTMNSGVIAGLPIVALGLTDPVGDRYEAVAMIDGSARVAGNGSASLNGGAAPYRKLVFDGDRLVGAVFAGLVDRAGVYCSFIETGLPAGADPARRGRGGPAHLRRRADERAEAAVRELRADDLLK